MHADHRGVDHLDSGILGSSKCVYDAAPDISPPPTDEAVVDVVDGPNISGRSRQGAPERKTQNMPLRTRRSLTRAPKFRSLNDRGLTGRNASGQVPVGRLRGQSGHQPADNLR